MRFPHSLLLHMARRTTCQKHVHSLLAAYQHIKHLQLHQRWRHTAHRQPTNHPVDRDSDGKLDTSTMSGLVSFSSFTLDSHSLLSLSDIDSGPNQDDIASGVHPDTPTSGGDLSLNASSDDSSDDSSQGSLPVKHQCRPWGLAHHICKAISAIYSSRYNLGRKFGHRRPPTYLPLILTAYKDHEEFHPAF